MDSLPCRKIWSEVSHRFLRILAVPDTKSEPAIPAQLVASW